MEQNRTNKEIAFHYLLGKLSDEEEERYEELYFADPLALEELQFFRDQLIEEYLYQALSDADRQLFEKNFLASPSHQEKLEITKAFMAMTESDNRLSAHPNATRSSDADKPGRLSQISLNSESPPESTAAWEQNQKPSSALSGSVFDFLRLHNRKLTWAFAILLLAVVGVLLLRRAFNEPQLLPNTESVNSNTAPPSEQQATQQNGNSNLNHNNRNGALPDLKKAYEKPVDQQSQIAVFLLSHNPRSNGGSEQTFVIEPENQTVQLQIAPVTDAYQRFRASINRASGAAIFAREFLPTAAQSIILTLPARLFASGDYVLRLDGISTQGKAEEADKYFFRVEKKAKAN
jgi:hypothetical protein